MSAIWSAVIPDSSHRHSTHVSPILANVTPFICSIARDSAPCGWGEMCIDEGITFFGNFSTTCGRIEDMSWLGSRLRRNWPSLDWKRRMIVMIARYQFASAVRGWTYVLFDVIVSIEGRANWLAGRLLYSVCACHMSAACGR